MRSGPLLMMIASAMFTLMVGIVKAARAELTEVEVMWWRAAVSVPLGWFLARGVGLRLGNLRVFTIRTVFGFSAMFCFFTAAQGLPLADMTLISKLQPVIIALLAPLALGRTERVGSHVWACLGLGFAGCVVLIGPDLGSGSMWGLWAVAATLLSAFAHMAVRKLGSTEHPFTLVFWFQLAVLALCQVLLLVREGKLLPGCPPSLAPWLVLCGIAGTAGQALMTWAYKIDRAATVAAASYVSPLWGALGGLLFFGESLDAGVTWGGGMIVLAGMALLLWRGAPARRLDPPHPVPAEAPATMRG